MDLNALKLPIIKKNLEVIYQALSFYRKSGEWAMENEVVLKAQDELKKKLDDSINDIVKQTNILLSQPSSERLARIRAFKHHEASLDILIAKIQILKGKLEKEVDSFIVDNLMEEIMDGGSTDV